MLLLLHHEIESRTTVLCSGDEICCCAAVRTVTRSQTHGVSVSELLDDCGGRREERKKARVSQTNAISLRKSSEPMISPKKSTALLSFSLHGHRHQISTDEEALMNEYRVPELNVQNGILKSLSFLQTTVSAVKHMALGIAGLGCEDALVHLLNYVWPNIFETSPHVINAVMEAIEGMRVALGATVVLNYCLKGLFHPARKVREVYWKIYNSLYIGAQDALVPSNPVLLS
ncbi:splicing factor [Actinidia rufa]|uniref:Splicing factor n=1 Tax=Actinidia rufa TaxID=165716 RepID=A0A7J0GG61_9ERIC|nr:splicing factor [Actinidia rufa]